MMTKQEAIEILNNKGFRFCDFERCVDFYSALNCEKCDEALYMAIEALEQEPCEDAISKGKLMTDLSGIWEDGYTPNLPRTMTDFQDMLEDIYYKIKNAPSVMPSREEPKRGMWIVYPLIDEGRVELECPICGDTFIRAVDYKPHFCENCGARMESGEEWT